MTKKHICNLKFKTKSKNKKMQQDVFNNLECFNLIKN